MNPTPATVATPSYLAGIWKADRCTPRSAFSVRLLTVGKVRGQFTSHDVTIVTSEDPPGSSVAAKTDLASIDTGNERRDSHLRSADFLEVEKHRTMSYRSTGIRQTGDGWIIDGELTMHGVTRVPLAVEVNGFGPDPERRPAGRLLRDRADQPRRLRHRPMDRWRRRGRRRGADQTQDRGRPPVTGPGWAAAHRQPTPRLTAATTTEYAHRPRGGATC